MIPSQIVGIVYPMAIYTIIISYGRKELGGTKVCDSPPNYLAGSTGICLPNFTHVLGCADKTCFAHLVTIIMITRL